MAGFRAGGWVCCGVLVFSLIIGIFGLRGIGLVGEPRNTTSAEKPLGDIELATRSPGVTLGEYSAGPSTTTVNTAVANTLPSTSKKESFEFAIPGLA